MSFTLKFIIYLFLTIAFATIISYVFYKEEK